MKKLIFPLLTLFCTGCMNIPQNRLPIEGFNIEKYMGKWYEIARLDHSFERGLSQVTAEYTLIGNGQVKVVNRGYSQQKGQWSQATGKAKFAGDKNTGHLKVSFFGPFYASYIIFELDKTNYQFAYVSGKNPNYLWFLSRTPIVSEQDQQRFRARAKAAGFDTEKLIFVDHEG
ncbi:MAG: lipocalin family protein [Candidatus Marinimicrobia bacterium]|nr:lipocalin family protein [Candidatus Neomarinimicrobiota bacterium]